MVTSGTGVNANIGAEGQWGKTGTTENNGDAWFCGATEEVTACVWVGYADTVTPMTTLYNGGPVMGGTFPALIWASVISAWEEITAERAAEKASREDGARATRATSTDSDDGRPKPKSTCRKPKRNRSNPKKRRPKPKRAGTGSGARRSGAGRTRARIGGGARRRRHRRLGPRPRDVGVAGEAEAPGALDRFRDPDPGAGDDLAARRPRAAEQEGSRAEVGAVVVEPDAERLGQLPRPRAELACRARSAVAAPAHLLQAGGRLEGADQDRGRVALGLGDEVEQAVDPVGEVDVGAARWPEERLGPRSVRPT